MALTGAALKEAIGNPTGFQTINMGTGAGASDFYASLKNSGPTNTVTAPAPTPVA